MDEATAFFGHATRLDIDNYNRNTGEGLHTTSIAAAWLNIVYGFGGLRSDDETLSFSPAIPENWKSCAFKLLYRGSRVSVMIMADRAVFKLEEGKPIEIKVYGEAYRLTDELSVRRPQTNAD
jgi:maltose phosphorylase